MLASKQIQMNLLFNYLFQKLNLIFLLQFLRYEFFMFFMFSCFIKNTDFFIKISRIINYVEKISLTPKEITFLVVSNKTNLSQPHLAFKIKLTVQKNFKN